MNTSLGYVILCVVVPFGWGVSMYFAFGWWQKRLGRRARKGGPPPIDYSI